MLEECVNKRLFFVDALKAFAIVLVVLGHLSQYTPLQDEVYGKIVTVFHMPLFMAVSGFVTCPERIHIDKRVRLLVPFLIFGSVWTFVNHGSIVGFLTDEAKYGYWYLPVLLTFCLLLFLIHKIQMRIEYGMLVVELLLGSLHLAFHHSLVATTLSTNHMFQLWPFFCLGILLRKGWLEFLKRHRCVVYATSILIVLVAMWGGQLLKAEGTLREYLNDFCSMFIVSSFFLLFAGLERKHYRKQFVSRLGKNTLQIYVLHYFFLHLSMQIVGTTFTLPICLEAIIAPLFAVMVACLCILVSNLLHLFHLGWVFGR